MSDKLQELTERLYNEGLSKGKVEGERILKESQAKADEIISAAKAEAERIVAEARSKAEDLAGKAESDVRMASQQALQATRKDIENLMVNALGASKVKECVEDPDFVKGIITAVAEKFSATESADLALVLPESLKDKLEPWVASELKGKLSGDIDVRFSKKIPGGFTIGPKDGSYYISLTEDSFNSLVAEYLRPVTRKLLFGE